MGKSIAVSEDNKWRAESDMRTLTEAAEIKKDKKRFNAAMAQGNKQVMNLKTAMSKANVE